MGKVFIVKSGFSLRDDPGLGMLVFSNHTGMIFACDDSVAYRVKNWLKGKSSGFSDSVYMKALGPGWTVDIKEAEYPTVHLLPSPNAFKIPIPSSPIVINWLLTGKCTNHCQYCYAEDLMRGKFPEPNKIEVKNTARAILDYNPLVVVLTGGDPLCSEHLDFAIEQLQGKTAIVLDTAGHNMTSSLAKRLHEASVFVRVSIDSEIPRINDELRPSANKKQSSTQLTLQALNILLNEGGAIGVQTVATKQNRSDFEAFGNKLFRLGIRSWRILTLAKSLTNIEIITRLSGPLNGQARFNDYIQKEIYSRHEKGWNRGMGVQITRNDIPNSVVLVSPDGRFLTESRITPGKVEFDNKNPKKPELTKMFELLDLHAHVSRYLA
jgi:MoaA/NifB/PqqE/SkfB family radical SAM enzyme